MSSINNFQNNINQPNPAELAMHQMVSVGNDIKNLSQVVAANSRYMADMIHMEIEKSERERRKHRKKEVSSWVAVVNDNFGMVKVFDDGTQSIINFAINLVPDFECYRFQMKGIEERQTYAGIHFKTANFWLIERIDKICGRGIYEKMVKKKVLFNGQIPKNKIQDALYAFFAPEIEKATVEQIPALAGWFKGEFISAETFWFWENEGFLELPVREKLFPNYEGVFLCPEKYFAKIRNIADWKNRIWMMLYPIGGMLSSLLGEAGIRLEKYLNFVILEDIPMKVFRQYLQVFNRDRGAEGTSRKDILQAKDEVLILDAYCVYGESKYKKAQKVQNFQSIANGVINGDFVTRDGFTINSSTAVFSDRIARKKQAINLFVDTDFFESGNDWKRIMQKEDTIGIALFYFVKYCEENMEEIKNFLKLGEDANPETAWLCFVFKIFQGFWESYGIDMQDMADLPESIDFHELLQSYLLFEDDLVTDFVKIVRAEIKKWPVRMKNGGEGNGEEVLYSDEFIWIPVKVLNQIFTGYGVFEQRYQFLEELKEKGFLITDEKGLSRKLQVAGKRYETYQFKRSLFHIPGTVDIVELGKEGENAEG